MRKERHVNFFKHQRELTYCKQTLCIVIRSKIFMLSSWQDHEQSAIARVVTPFISAFFVPMEELSHMAPRITYNPVVAKSPCSIDM